MLVQLTQAVPAPNCVMCRENISFGHSHRQIKLRFSFLIQSALEKIAPPSGIKKAGEKLIFCLKWWPTLRKKVEPKQLQPWSRFMVRNSAPPLALFWCHMIIKGKNGSTLQGGTVFQNGSRVEPFWFHFFSQCRSTFGGYSNPFRFAESFECISYTAQIPSYKAPMLLTEFPWCEIKAIMGFPGVLAAWKDNILHGHEGYWLDFFYHVLAVFSPFQWHSYVAQTIKGAIVLKHLPKFKVTFLHMKRPYISQLANHLKMVLKSRSKKDGFFLHNIFIWTLQIEESHVVSLWWGVHEIAHCLSYTLRRELTWSIMSDVIWLILYWTQMLNIQSFPPTFLCQVDLTSTQSFTFHACCRKCILRRITSGNKLAIFYRLNCGCPPMFASLSLARGVCI